MEDVQKIKSLLKFYKKRGVNIQLKFNYPRDFIATGVITKMGFWSKYIILNSKELSPVKIFLEDIYCDSIMPANLNASSKHKNKNKNTREGISPKLRYDILTRDKYVCQGCGACGPRVEVEVDHKVPVSRGGKDTPENLQTLCFKCNRGKGDQIE